MSEIEGFKDYEKDQVFLEAINEDYDFIIKYYQEQLQVLKQLERVDAQNYLLQTHNTKGLEDKIQETEDKRNEFQSIFMNKASVFI